MRTGFLAYESERIEIGPLTGSEKVAPGHRATGIGPRSLPWNRDTSLTTPQMSGGAVTQTDSSTILTEESFSLAVGFGASPLAHNVLLSLLLE
jgi:hypothetical protein